MTRALPVLTCALLLAIGGCSSRPPAPQPRVRLAYLQADLHHLPLWIALEKGLFRAEGVDVEVAGVFRSGAELVAAFRAGDLDAAYVGQAPVTIAVARGAADLQVLARVNAEGSSLVAREGGPVHGLEQLRGRTVAIPSSGSMQDLVLGRALREAGLEGQVKVVALRVPEMESALRDGQIDAFTAWEPFGTRARQAGVGRVIAGSHELWAGHPCCVVAARRAFLDARPAAARALRRAHRSAVAYLHAHPEEAVSIAVRYSGHPEAVVREAMQRVIYDEHLSAPHEEALVRDLVGRGYVEATTDPPRLVERLLALEPAP